MSRTTGSRSTSDRRAYRRIDRHGGDEIDLSAWPATVQAAAIGAHLRAERGPGYPSWAYFLRADTMHGVYTYLEENPGRRPERFHELSHGEGFLEILRTRVNQAGFYLMDEPDAPLSFVSCLSLVALLHDLGEAGAQVVVATHSPIVAAVPGARILELGDWGMRPASWDELEIVAEWRAFLCEPQSFFRHLLDQGGFPSNL